MRLHNAVKTVSGFLTECAPQQLSQLMTDINCDAQTFARTPSPHSLFQLCNDDQEADRAEIVDVARDADNELTTF